MREAGSYFNDETKWIILRLLSIPKESFMQRNTCNNKIKKQKNKNKTTTMTDMIGVGLQNVEGAYTL